MPFNFSAPVGDLESPTLWPPGWVDATGYLATGDNYAGRSDYHTGADLNCNTPAKDADAHAPVYACADGLVVFAGELSPWGNVITIKHTLPDNTAVWSRYGHVETLHVKAGDGVSRGQHLCHVGKPPGDQPYHLHFDIARVNLGTRPGDWPGTDKARVLRDYYDPKLFIEQNRTFHSEDHTMKATVRNAASSDPRIGAYVWENEARTVKMGSLPNGAVVTILKVNPQTNNAWLQASVGGANLQSVSSPDAPVLGFVHRSLLQFELKPITFKTTTPSVRAGSPITLIWSTSDIEGAWLFDNGVNITPDGVPGTTPGWIISNPIAGTHVYRLRVQDHDWTYRWAEVTVTVLPKV